MAETRLSVHVYDRQYQTVQFLNYSTQSAEKFGGPVNQSINTGSSTGFHRLYRTLPLAETRNYYTVMTNNITTKFDFWAWNATGYFPGNSLGELTALAGSMEGNFVAQRVEGPVEPPPPMEKSG